MHVKGLFQFPGIGLGKHVTSPATGAFHSEDAPEIVGFFLCRHGAKVRQFAAAGGEALGAFYDAPQRLPVSSIVHLGNTCIPEYFGGFPAMNARAAAEDHRSAQIPDPADVHFDTIYGNIESAGDMSLVEFKGCPKIDDNAALP
jgi:hypothetical protein